MATQVVMPQLGESVVEGTITQWFKKQGETVQEMEPLLEVETDKVTSEVPSVASGTVLQVLVSEGTTVRAGTVLAWIGQPGEEVGSGAPAPAHAAEAPAPAAAASTPQKSASTASPGRDRDLGFISPVVARLAKENQVDLYQVKGTGEGGRITKKDVLTYMESKQGQKAPAPEPAAWETPGEGDLFRPTELVFGPGGPAGTKQAEKNVQQTAAPAPVQSRQPAAMPPVSTGSGDRIIPHTNMRRSIAEHMVASKLTSPHVTTVMEANLQKVVAHLQANKAQFERDGARLTYTAYFVSAAVQALRAFPIVNSSWSDDGIIIHSPVNIGMATSLGEEGLIVPVIKGADGMSLLGLARTINDLAGRARLHKLQPDEVKDGTFTITNHGISGSLFATPVINQPQCAILGVGAIQKRVVVIDDAIAIRPMAYLSLTFDHRILDGASADGFLAKVVAALENWQ